MPELISDRKKVARFRAFWRREETDRPLIGATIATIPSVRAVRGHGILSPEDLDIEENVRELEEEWEQWRDVSGDAMWCANPLWAFPWHLAIAGCPVERNGDSLWSLPALTDWSQLESVRFERSNPWFQLLVQLIRAIREKSGGRYPVGLGHMMTGPVDMMMELRGQERLALDIYDHPGELAALGEHCVELCSEVSDALFAIEPPYLGGYVGTLRWFWAPGKMVETAEDLSFMTSPATHMRYVVPLHRAIGERFPFTILHLHSAQLHTVSTLLEIDEIAAIEITPDYGEDLLPYLPLMGRILERKPLIVHGIVPVPAVKEMMRSLPARGLALFCRCDTPVEAKAVLNALT